MRSFRKNIGGNWEVCTITIEEVKSIQEKIIRIGLGKLLELHKVAEDNKVVLSDACAAVILAKVTPSFESLANDFIEAAIQKKLNPPQA